MVANHLMLVLRIPQGPLGEQQMLLCSEPSLQTPCERSALFWVCLFVLVCAGYTTGVFHSSVYNPGSPSTNCRRSRGNGLGIDCLHVIDYMMICEGITSHCSDVSVSLCLAKGGPDEGGQ